MELPKRYDQKAAEKKWQAFWEKEKLFAFDQESDKPLFSIDTPPPTVSGRMHIGHAFGYAQQDMIARFQRMRGNNVFFPFGTDDNGLPTERLVEKEKKVKATKMERKEFIKLCMNTVAELRPDFIQDWKNIGMSCDWDICYSTIDDQSRKISQQSFLDLVKDERIYRKEAPVMWDPHMQTALAQVELEDKEVPSTFNDIIFKDEKGNDIIIATTRPELVCACVAVFVHPDDKRYKNLIGKKLTTPVYKEKVEVLADERVDQEKGTGIVMCCTFGDQTDIEWYKAFNLPNKVAITKDGKMTELAQKYEGLSIKEARKAILEDMQSSGELKSQKEITHTIKVGERSGEEIEILESPQWFIKYLDLKKAFLKLGKELKWHPDFMRNRYDNWVKGLQWDWCISRQRYFGVPFPVWYSKKTGEPIFASPEQLPVDPLTDLPKNMPADHTKEDLIPETDTLDTWATSSLSPDLARALVNKNMQAKLKPMDLRPQGHDIISFWLFNTVVKSYLHDKALPWKHTTINGWVLDPKGKKMSKSKGNVIDPRIMLEKYSADALRYWASGSSLGDDLPFQEKDLVTGIKTVNKLWNASKFSIMNLEHWKGKEGKPRMVDLWMQAKLHKVIKQATEELDHFKFAQAKHEIEKVFFQQFCDLYLELVKDRLYNTENWDAEDVDGGRATLYSSLFAQLKLFAPFIPYITEEIYQLFFKEKEKQKSIHLCNWPNDLVYDESAEKAGDCLAAIVQHVRKAKTEKQFSMKEPVKELQLTLEDPKILEGIQLEIEKSLHVQNITCKQGSFSVEVIFDE